MRRKQAVLLTCSALIFAGGCHQDMWNQPKAKAQSLSDSIFADGENSRPTVQGTVAFGKARLDRKFYTAFDENGRLVNEFPVAVNEAFLKRGQERFKIFCSPCHGELGNGKGFIAQRGFTLARPVGNYHSDRLRKMPVGHFYDVITNGFGTMYSFKSRIEPMDRWAIAAYIRVLQESQHTSISEIPDAEKQALESLPRTLDQDASPELPIGKQSPIGNDVVPERREVPIGKIDRLPQGGGQDSSEPVGGGVARPMTRGGR